MRTHTTPLSLASGAVAAVTILLLSTSGAVSADSVVGSGQRSDPRPANPIAAQAIAGTSVWFRPTQPGWVAVSGEVFDLAADGTGVFYQPTILGGGFNQGEDYEFVAEPLTWSLEGGGVVVDFVDFSEVFLTFLDPDNVVEVYGFDQEVGDFLRQAVEEGRWVPSQDALTETTESQRSQVLRRLRDRTLVRRFESGFYSIDELLTQLGWPGDLPRAQIESESEFLLLDMDERRPRAGLLPRVGDTVALPLVLSPQDPRVLQPVVGFGHDLFTLLPSGQTTPGLLGGTAFDWRLTAEGELLFTTAAAEYRYRIVTSAGDLQLYLITIERAGQQTVRMAQWGAVAASGAERFGDDLLQELPEYWQAGINLSLKSSWMDDGRIEFEQFFGYTFRGDGLSTRIFPGQYPECLDDPDAGCFTLDNSPWSWTADGTRIVRTQTVSFLRERQWEVLRYEPDGRAVVLEFAVIDAGSGAEWFIFPRLNTQQRYRLDVYPDAWQDALDDGLEF